MSSAHSALNVRAAGSPQPAEPPQLEAQGDDLCIAFDDRYYRIRGLADNHDPARLRINLHVRRDEGYHLDTLDLCKSRSRAAFIRAAAAELYVDELTLKRDLGQLLLALEAWQQERAEAEQPAAVALSDRDRRAALELLRDPRLSERILDAYQQGGMVGEESNKLLCYLACTSRLLAQPLAVLIQSSSAAGKTSLMDATLALMPAEEQVRYSALTGQSLYYMGGQDLRHKILAVAEEAGLSEAAYAFKLLQSDGSLRIAAAGKSRGTARQTTASYHVQGPVMMFLTTTAEHPDDELANRCLTLQVNESARQTAAIQARQRAAYTLAERQAKQQQQQTARLHHNAQRLLEPLPVVFPWAEQLAFRHDQTRMRRDHARYLSLIAAGALLHQHQRAWRSDEEGSSYIEAAPADVRLANRLLSESLGDSLESLLPRTRQLLELIHDYVHQQASTRRARDKFRFTQRQLREAIHWGDFALRRHLRRLIDLEYILPSRGGRGNQRQYQLLYDGQGGDGRARFLLGLADPDQLQSS